MQCMLNQTRSVHSIDWPTQHSGILPDLPITPNEHPTSAGHLGSKIGVPGAANEAVQPPNTTAEMGTSLTNKSMHANTPLSLQTAVKHTASSVASSAAVNHGNNEEKVTGAVLMFVEEAVGLKNFQQLNIWLLFQKPYLTSLFQKSQVFSTHISSHCSGSHILNRHSCGYILHCPGRNCKNGCNWSCLTTTKSARIHIHQGNSSGILLLLKLVVFI